MSIFHCEGCDRTLDSDFSGYEWIDDLDCAYCDDCYADLCESAQDYELGRADWERDVRIDEEERDRMGRENDYPD